MDVLNLDIVQISEGLRRGNFSSVEITQSCLKHIKETDDLLKSFITLTEELALTQAQEADKRLRSGESGWLLGVPCSLKDVILTKGVRTTAASNILQNYFPAEDATVVTRLKKAGAVILGKVNCDAFAHGSSTEYSDFFTSHNPWNLERVPGGSSGGSATSVAGRQCFYSIGTDTGGSIRQPAAFCNLVGLKPTYGRVSRQGVMAMTSSTDCPAIMGKTVQDVAVVLQEIAGEDKKDSISSTVLVDKYLELMQNFDVKGIKIGIPVEYFLDSLDSEVKKKIDGAIDVFRKQGAEIVEISLPHTKYAVPVYYILTPAEISSNLAKFDGIRFGYSAVNDKEVNVENLSEVYTKSRGKGFNHEVKRRIILGTYVLSSGYYEAYYLQAQKVRALIKQDFDRAFQKVDVILTPTVPNIAHKIGKYDNPVDMYLGDIFLSAVSLAGLPAVSVPCGFIKPKEDDTEMPIGMQLIGKYFEEATLLGVAQSYEQIAEWKNMRSNF